VDGVNCGLDLLLFCHAAPLNFPLKVRKHPPGNVAFHGFYGELLGSFTLSESKRLNLPEWFGGQGDIGVRGYDYLVLPEG
jgi:hypothetical protein